jgi:hypothetical protein
MALFTLLRDLFTIKLELVVKEGEVADDGMLASMMFYVQGIDGEVPQ